MDIFGGPNIEKMARENDRDGLYRCLEHRDSLVRLQAARALAEMGDGAGWRFLMNAAGDTKDETIQEAAAAILGELGTRSSGDAHRVIPVLGEALKNAHGDTADAIRDSLIEIGGDEANEALREAGYTPSLEEPVEEVSDYDTHFVRPVLPNTLEIEFLSPEEHLNTAVELHEADLYERGLVACSLALWGKPDWAYAWYLRGVLMEDLERPYEAWLAYRRAVHLDPALKEAEEALEEIEGENNFQPPEEEFLLPTLTVADWKARRDAAAGLGGLGEENPRMAEYAARLADLLLDEEREVRYAAIYSLGQLGSRSAVIPLTEMNESSWLLRFAIIEALSRLGSVDGLVTVLNGEMDRLMDRNPAFSSIKDPLIEVEYSRLLEIGVLALERSGDIESLVAIAEGNAWEEVSDAEELDAVEAYAENPLDNTEGEEDEEEAEEDLTAYVDEVGQMAAAALERLALPRLSELDPELLRRLADVPDLTLIDLSDGGSEEDEETGLVYDFSGLREAARVELARRERK